MTDWREELVEAMAKATFEIYKGAWEQARETSRKIYLREARAALAVAEPVIREQTGGKLRAENARLREALLIAELMASEMGIDPREKCQKIYEYLHDIREGGNEN